MKIIFGFFLVFSIFACVDTAQTKSTTTVDITSNVTDSIKLQSSATVFKPFDFDTSYELSKEHIPFMVTGLFNPDNILDTALLIRNKSTGKDALFIKHGKTDKTFLLKQGKDVGTDFPDFNWVGQFELIKKGTNVWENVVYGEIVGENQVPDNKKITMLTDALFLHVEESSGGGIIYYKSGKYIWVQQD